MQEAPGRIRAATFDFDIEWHSMSALQPKPQKFCPQFWPHHQWLPAPDVHEEDEDNGGGQLDQGDGDEAGGIIK